MPQQERVNLAVFIDFDNIEIGVKTTLGEHFDIGTILEALKERGEVVTKIAYADWTRAGEYSRALTQHAIRLVQRNLTPGGDKNGADINLALDALEMAFTHPHINAYVIVGGDSDFLSLVEKLKQYDKKVFVVGGRAFTSVILQRNCHEFIAYENLMRKPASRGGRVVAPAASAPVAQAFPIVRRALKILADREVSPQTGLLKSTLLQLDSTFSERSYGASSFLDFVEKLTQAGLVQMKQAGRSVMVELNPGFEESDTPAERPPAAAAAAAPIEVAGDAAPAEVERPIAPAEPAATAGAAGVDEREGPVPAQVGDNATGVRIVSEILTAATSARWPMYLRNVKQILRAAGGFDERRYGFSGLIDLLRACQREGWIRLERDRRGGLRVFQGPALNRNAPATPRPLPPERQPNEPARETGTETGLDADGDDSLELTQAEFAHILAPPEPEPAIIDTEPVAVVDTTAELLGRAKPKRPRARAGASAHGVSSHAPASRTRKTAAKRAPATRATRSRKKAAASDSDD